MVVASLCGVYSVAARSSPQGRPQETLFYCISEDPRCLKGLESYSSKIGTLGLLGYGVDAEGQLSDFVSPNLVRIAQSKGVKVVPLVYNNNFDQSLFHLLLQNIPAQQKMIKSMIDLAVKNGYHGWQLDFENIRYEDREKFSHLSQEIAAQLRPAGLEFSIAVVPRTSDEMGPTAYHRWMYENWTGGYDYRALAEVADFLSLMTYDQHTRRTPPGTVAGKEWTENTLRFLKSQGVDMTKVSLGIPAYSHYWYPSYNDARLGHMAGQQLPFDVAHALIETRKVFRNEQLLSWSLGDVNEYLSLEDATTFKAKLPLLGKFRLRGISVFRLGWEDPLIWDSLPVRTHNVNAPRIG